MPWRSQAVQIGTTLGRDPEQAAEAEGLAVRVRLLPYAGLYLPQLAIEAHEYEERSATTMALSAMLGHHFLGHAPDAAYIWPHDVCYHPTSCMEEDYNWGQYFLHGRIAIPLPRMMEWWKQRSA